MRLTRPASCSWQKWRKCKHFDPGANDETTSAAYLSPSRRLTGTGNQERAEYRPFFTVADSRPVQCRGVASVGRKPRRRLLFGNDGLLPRLFLCSFVPVDGLRHAGERM